MDLNCPSCGTTFRIDPKMIGPAGRSVRCGSCGHSWRQMRPESPAPSPPPTDPAAGTTGWGAELAAGSVPPAAETPKAVAPKPIIRRAAAKRTAARSSAPQAGATSPRDPRPDAPRTDSSRTDSSRTDSPRTGSPRTDSPSSVAPMAAAAEASSPPKPLRPAAPPAARQSSGGWFTFFVVVAALAAIAYFGRGRIIEQVPQAAGLYALVGLGPGPIGDYFDLEVTHRRRVTDGRSELVIEGTIVNLSDDEQPIPALRARVSTPGGGVIQEWDFQAEADTLESGGTTLFRTQTADPQREVVVEVLLIAW